MNSNTNINNDSLTKNCDEDFLKIKNRILYTDSNFVIVTKLAGEICEDVPPEYLNSPQKDYYLPYIFSVYFNKKLYCVHRLDRPVTGFCILAFSSKSAAILTNLFTQESSIKKTYWAIIEGVVSVSKNDNLISNYISFNSKKQKAFCSDIPHHKSKKAQLTWNCFAHGKNYSFFKINLLTGRTHQIRCQLAKNNMHIKGDLKYGAKRSDVLGGIRLHAAYIEFINPFTKEFVKIFCPLPNIDNLWNSFLEALD